MTNVNAPLEQYRLPAGVPNSCVAILPFMMQLMSALESVRAALRWLQHVQRDTSEFHRRDTLMAMIAGCGWCAEAFKLLTCGAGTGLIEHEMVNRHP